ncbi:metalloregulator ArsR/SmtB family transcription factor [Curvivirga aplysinae]|uniref:metalloregulator ArsR/SmtB family transcription factor n=1 Tax=Curvivirga aplysinae TaxID=2529852 RepID=UPI0012BB5EE5|nr:metalloregulator ArsR/SmtB family transcription factor [Curvivirga aplysinae]MTI08435.1 metalloregulator ArsR/SmtB family transcription factor [Curvivirga aplysinae]
MVSATTRKVLFLCTGNSARSQVAEALFRSLAGDGFIVESAGMNPSHVDQRVFEVLSGFEISSAGLVSKSVETLDIERFDYIITLCDRAKMECATYPNHSDLMHWDLEDPKPKEGLKPFVDLFTDLKDRITLFLLLNGEGENTVEGPIELFKVLSDPLRLKVFMLLEDEGALTVSDFTNVLGMSQPKVSRHLALLRESGFLSVQKEGLWVFYKFTENLPVWIRHVISTIRNGNPGIINAEKQLLNKLENRKFSNNK